MTKSPPLSREGVETLWQSGQSLVAGMFAQEVSPPEEQRTEALPLETARSSLRLDDEELRTGFLYQPLDLVGEGYLPSPYLVLHPEHDCVLLWNP